MSSDATGILEQTLLSREILSKEELREARQYAEKKQITLTSALIDLEALCEDDIAALFADACKVRPMKLEDVEIDRESVRHVPARVAHRHKLIPVRRSGNTLVVAMRDPGNVDAWKALRDVTDFEIVVFVGKLDAIEHALYVHYGEPPEADEKDTDIERDLADGAPMVPDERFAHIGRSIPLQRRYTFDTVIEDSGSQYALGLAKTMVNGSSDEQECPLLMWGPDGSGKTHLLHSIANYLTTHDPLKKYILTTGEAFADHLFDCLSRLKLNLFRYFYRDAKCLLIDDCDALMGRNWAQQELAETIAALRASGSQVALCSTVNLADDLRTSPALKAEIHKGSIAEFEAYSPEGRARVLAAQLGQIDIPPGAIQRLSSGYSGDMKSLQSLMKQLAAVSVLENREVTDEIVEEWLAMQGVELAPRTTDSVTDEQE